jgi:PAS domain-containing protein
MSPSSFRADVFETTDALVAALDPDYRVVALNRAFADGFEAPAFERRVHLAQPLLRDLAVVDVLDHSVPANDVAILPGCGTRPRLSRGGLEPRLRRRF